MTAAPPLAAVVGDVFWCLGAGMLLAVVRQALGLLMGNGKILCFVWDLLTCAAAAVLLCGFSAGVSASGVSRWYMALGMFAGAWGWSLTAAPAINSLIFGILKWLFVPFDMLEKALIRPVSGRLREKNEKYLQKLKLCPKKKKKMLQKTGKILYN